ncbi:hypothetical protein IHE55_15710 [Streptomyces pactum]|uniref:Uncharacterized protein n=1 Tax=Streptomyces pactum TaxID=68249 RepID=A0ABS0NLU4_9ACTN|nr:hypothetical protein [Streptomyces pactum]MBH5336153.1 hypothetical protein [Streptomyces pactum]
MTEEPAGAEPSAGRGAGAGSRSGAVVPASAEDGSGPSSVTLTSWRGRNGPPPQCGHPSARSAATEGQRLPGPTGVRARQATHSYSRCRERLSRVYSGPW